MFPANLGIGFIYFLSLMWNVVECSRADFYFLSPSECFVSPVLVH